MVIKTGVLSGKATIMDKIFETNFVFHVKWCTMGKSFICIFQYFFASIDKVTFWEKNWALGYNSIKS